MVDPSLPETKYLIRHRRCWYVRISVPPTVQKTLKKTHIVRSLRTRDLDHARNSRWQVVADIKKEIAEAKAIGSKQPEDFRSDYLKAEPRRIVAHVTGGGGHIEEVTEREIVHDFIADEAHEISLREGRTAAYDFMRRATSSLSVQEITEQWLLEEGGELKQQTVHQYRYAVRLFSDFIGGVPCGEITRRDAGRFVSEVLITSDRSKRTQARLISSLSTLWKWLLRRGIAESNVWQDQANYGRKGKPSSKRHYTVVELRKLYEADPHEHLSKKYAPAVFDLVRMGLFTGCRLDELCSLTKEQIQQTGQAIWIREGKTEAAHRLMPIVDDEVWSIVERRHTDTNEDALFPELPPGGPDSKRGWTTSKRFTNFRRKVLGDTGKELDFHSLRRSFATYAEKAQVRSLAVTDSVIAELMGHKKATMALHTYSGGVGEERLGQAMQVITHEINEDLRS